MDNDTHDDELFVVPAPAPEPGFRIPEPPADIAAEMASDDESAGVNPRWLACAAALGVNPMELRGRQYVPWILGKWGEWDRLTGRAPGLPGRTQEEHREFDAWLAARGASETERLARQAAAASR